MNPNPAQGQESKCKNMVGCSLVDPKPLHSKKREHNPPPAPPNAYPDDRRSPTWGSNLMHVKDRPDNGTNDEINTNTDLGLGENLNGIEQFVEEFQKGVVIKKPANKVGESSGNNSSVEDVDDEDMNEDALRRSEEIQEDSQVINYFAEQLEEYKIKQKTRRAALDNQISSPAQAGIPVTTPKASPVPRRPKKSVKFEDIEDCSSFETIGGSEEQINMVEDSDEEYREWEMRLKRLQSALEQSLMDIEKKRAKSECSRE